MLLLVLSGLIPLVITPGILFHYDIVPKITGRRPEALAEAERALVLDGSWDVEVAQTAPQLRSGAHQA